MSVINVECVLCDKRLVVSVLKVGHLNWCLIRTQQSTIKHQNDYNVTVL